MSSKYRTFDGSCNNPVRSSWGQALTGYKRLLHPRYADGIEEVSILEDRYFSSPSRKVFSFSFFTYNIGMSFSHVMVYDRFNFYVSIKAR